MFFVHLSCVFGTLGHCGWIETRCTVVATAGSGSELAARMNRAEVLFRVKQVKVVETWVTVNRVFKAVHGTGNPDQLIQRPYPS